MNIDSLAKEKINRLSSDSAFPVTKPIYRICFALILALVFANGILYQESLGRALIILGILNFTTLLFFKTKILLLKQISLDGFTSSCQSISTDHLSLPSFSILVPLKNEGKIIKDTFSAINALDYPNRLYEVIIIIEKTDGLTQETVQQIVLPTNFRVLYIDSLPPFTKGRALCHGINEANGKYITVFDAESRPNANQLKMVAQELEKAVRPTCLQAIIRIENKNENYLTKFFAAEYIDWFEKHINILTIKKMPFGLGGNSFYLKKSLLEDIGGWDPFNVTEDAELSVRIARADIDLKLIPSYTVEKCPNTLSAWIHQRVRWNKGLLTTQLIHLFRSIKTFNAREWSSFWIRMLAGTLLPFFTVFIFVFVLVNAEFVFQNLWISKCLWTIFGGSLFVSLFSDRTTFKSNMINHNFFSLVLGTFIYMILYIVAGILAYVEFTFWPLKWNKTEH